ncbi:hypothetical protein BC332_15968 [Capsicum chinense]|nr:hypothetical protein BC332_15968 [Capsicum chinense]
MNFHESNMLTPRCRFDVNLKDNIGSTIGTISGKEGEKLLSLTAEQIYDLASTESNFLQQRVMGEQVILIEVGIEREDEKEDQINGFCYLSNGLMVERIADIEERDLVNLVELSG